jgi:hypothetical protein
MNVVHSTFGKGTIISQDDNNVTIDFNGVTKTLIKRFANLFNEDGTPYGEHAAAPVVKKSRGQKKRERDAREIAAFNALSNLQKLINAIMRINGKIQGDRNSLGYQLIHERLSGIWIVAREKGDTKVMDIIKSVEASMRCSDKQAYCIAKFADDNGLSMTKSKPAVSRKVQRAGLD